MILTLEVLLRHFLDAKFRAGETPRLLTVGPRTFKAIMGFTTPNSKFSKETTRLWWSSDFGIVKIQLSRNVKELVP